jgi:hypothetical protein
LAAALFACANVPYWAKLWEKLPTCPGRSNFRHNVRAAEATGRRPHGVKGQKPRKTILDGFRPSASSQPGPVASVNGAASVSGAGPRRQHHFRGGPFRLGNTPFTFDSRPRTKAVLQDRRKWAVPSGASVWLQPPFAVAPAHKLGWADPARSCTYAHQELKSYRGWAMPNERAVLSSACLSLGRRCSCHAFAAFTVGGSRD